MSRARSTRRPIYNSTENDYSTVATSSYARKRKKQHSFKPELNERLKDNEGLQIKSNRSPSFNESAQFAYSSPQNEITLVLFIKLIVRALESTRAASFSFGPPYSVIAALSYFFDGTARKLCSVRYSQKI